MGTGLDTDHNRRLLGYASGGGRRPARRRAALLLALVLAAVSVLGASVARAPAQSAQTELQSKLSELEDVQAQSGDLRATIDRQNAQVDQLIGQLSALKLKQSGVQEELDAKQAELDEATAELNAEQAHLDQVRSRLKRAIGSLKKLLVQIYKSGQPDVLTVILESASWADVLAQGEYLDRVQNYDEAVISRVESLRDEITEIVAQLADVQQRIATARNEVAAKRDELASARSELEARHSELIAARHERAQNLQALLDREQALTKEISPSAVPPGGQRATLLPNGDAVPPRNAPLPVRAAIEAANQINDKPYLWGGGHGSFEASGYDCSGAVSYALHGAGWLSSPLDSSGLMVWGSPGGGNWVTVYAHPGHAYAVIAGLRWDTSGNASGSGPRWSTAMRSLSGYVARHPAAGY